MLTSLTHLDLSGNALLVLPREIGQLLHLKELLLFDNVLRELPWELGHLHHLRSLGLEGNPLDQGMIALLNNDGPQGVVGWLRDCSPVSPPPPEREWIQLHDDLGGDENRIVFSLS